MSRWMTRPTSSTSHGDLMKLPKEQADAILAEHRAYDAQEKERLRRFCQALSKLSEEHGFVIQGDATINNVEDGTTVRYHTAADHWLYLRCAYKEPVHSWG